MKALSVWQPWASLIISGKKRIQTRPWPAPSSVRGQRIAIASTKAITAEQRKASAEQSFRENYAATGLPPLDELPRASVLGTVLVETCREIDSALLELIDEQECAFGWYEPGRFAWLLRDPEPFDRPVPVRGGQGLWNWSKP